MRIPFTNLALGDLVTFPDGHTLSIRAKAPFTTPVRHLSGFVVAGECAVVLTVPALDHEPVGVHLPGRLPDGAGVYPLVEGAASYWAPHLPSVRGAMGELLWRVVHVDGIAEPVVVLYRGEEKIPFVRRAVVWPGQLTFAGMPRTADNDVDVARHSAHVLPATIHAEQLFDTFVRPASR